MDKNNSKVNIILVILLILAIIAICAMVSFIYKLSNEKQVAINEANKLNTEINNLKDTNN